MLEGGGKVTISIKGIGGESKGNIKSTEDNV